MDLSSGLNDASARARLAVVSAHLANERDVAMAESSSVEENELVENEERARCKRQRELLEACATLTMQVPVLSVDARTAQEVEDAERARVLLHQQVKKVKRILPGIGRGNSGANQEASRTRRPLVHPYHPSPGGIYTHFTKIPWVGDADGFRQMTGFNREEFDQFYEDTH